MASLTLQQSYPSAPRHAAPQPVNGPVSAIHRFALFCVWATIVVSAIVFTEPAPVDVLMIGLVLLLPTIGLIRITPPLLLFGAIWLGLVMLKLLAAVDAVEPAKVLVHTGVTFFLVAGSFTLAGFVMRRPGGHVTLIYNAYVWAAILAAVAGLAGYFQLVPGAAELFTRYGRASGTFKDPNVFGPFLVPPLLYLMHLMLNARLHRLPMLAIGAILLSGAVLVSFSRGAWLNLFIAVGLFALLSLVTARTNWQRVKIVGAGLLASLVVIMGVLIALQSDGVGRFLQDRAQLSQTYDEGPEGRFGGQMKALRLILEHPFGIGAQQFSPSFHFEEPHNVYLAMYLNAGWIGGSIFLAMFVLTIAYGFRHALRPTRTQALFLIAYSAFVANAVEGLLIDLDHWRHVHLLFAIVWGLMLSDRQLEPSQVPIMAPPLRMPEIQVLAGRPPREITRAKRSLETHGATARRPVEPARRLPSTKDRLKGYAKQGARGLRA